MKRNHEIRIKLSKEEYDKLKRKVEKLGMTISGFARYLLQNSTLSVHLGE